MSVKLEKGFYGGCSPMLGAYSYRGFDVIVCNGESSMPVDGGDFCVGIYKEGDESGQAIGLWQVERFHMFKCQMVVDRVIDSILRGSNDHEELDRVLSGMSDVEACTCGAKYTSNPSFHLASVCNIK